MKQYRFAPLDGSFHRAGLICDETFVCLGRQSGQGQHGESHKSR
jgi:hypothetical protein